MGALRCWSRACLRVLPPCSSIDAHTTSKSYASAFSMSSGVLAMSLLSRALPTALP
jgi:hypothetical protein